MDGMSGPASKIAGALNPLGRVLDAAGKAVNRVGNAFIEAAGKFKP